MPGIFVVRVKLSVIFFASFVFILYLSVKSIFNTQPWFVQVFLNRLEAWSLSLEAWIANLGYPQHAQLRSGQRPAFVNI